MSFTRRHEAELREIRTLVSGLGDHASEARGILEGISDAQEKQLAGRQGRGKSSMRRPEPAPPLIAFVHIPKTAGGTVSGMFARAYSKQALSAAGNFIRGPEQTRRKISRRPGGWERWCRSGGRVTVGHVPYGVFQELLPPETRYMTLLREPVDRVLSHYYRHIHGPDMTPADRAERRERGRATAGSVEEALVELRLPQLRNLATRFLCGYPSPMEDLPPDALDAAKENLRRFDFVGIQERFEESIVLLQRTFGLGMVPYVNRHVSVEGGRPAVEEVPDDERSLILEHNWLDAELYGFGAGLFESAVAAADDGFREEVAALRALAANTEVEAFRLAGEWLDRHLPPGATGDYFALRAGAKKAGVPMPAFKELLRRSTVKAPQEGADGKLLVRIEEGSQASPGAGGQAGRQMVVTTQDGSTRVITR